MKIVTANGKKSIKISKREWTRIGEIAGWKPSDLNEQTDRDIGPFYTAQEEEDALLGPEENMTEEQEIEFAYEKGKEEAEHRAKYEDMQRDKNYWCKPPYRTDTDSGRKLFDAWRNGYWDKLTEMGLHIPSIDHTQALKNFNRNKG